ncbi:hypothetical protein ACLOJK_038269 [Asimina triloba]
MDLLMDREDEVDDDDGFDGWPWLDQAKLSAMDLLAGADGGAGLDESLPRLRTELSLDQGPIVWTVRI